MSTKSQSNNKITKSVSIKTFESYSSTKLLGYFMFIDLQTLSNIVIGSVQFKLTNRLEIIKLAKQVGLNINDMPNNSGDCNRLIVYAIRANDLATFLICVREKPDLSNVNGNSLLHEAVMENNIFATKYFCKLLDINEINSNDMSPIGIACRTTNQPIFDILIQAGATELSDGAEFLILYLTKQLDPHLKTDIDFTDPQTYIDAEQILVKLMNCKLIAKSVLKDYFCSLVINKCFNILKAMCDNYPDMITHCRFDNHKRSLLSMVICMNYTDLALYMLDKISVTQLNDDKDEENANCLQEAACTGNVEIIKHILNKTKDLVNETDKNKVDVLCYLFKPRTTAVNIAHMIEPKTHDSTITIIKLLVNNGYNKSSKTCVTSLYNAIIFWDAKIISVLIDLGFPFGNNNEPKKAIMYENMWLPYKFKDYISEAVRCDKLDIVKLLVETNAPLFYLKLNKERIYISVIFAIMFCRSDILEYLYQIDEIKKSINQSVYYNMCCFATSCSYRIDAIRSVTGNQFNDNDKESKTLEYLNNYLDKGDMYFDIYHDDYVIMEQCIQHDTLIQMFMVAELLCHTVKVHQSHPDNNRIFCRTGYGTYPKTVNIMFSKIEDLLDSIDRLDDIYGQKMLAMFKTMHYKTLIPYDVLYEMFYRIIYLYRNYHNWMLNKAGKKTDIPKDNIFKLKLNQNNEWIDADEVHHNIKKAISWKTTEEETSLEIIKYVKIILNGNRYQDKLKEYRDYVLQVATNLSPTPTPTPTPDNQMTQENVNQSDDTTDLESYESDYDDIWNSEINVKNNSLTNSKVQNHTQLTVQEIKHKLRKLHSPVTLPHYKNLFQLLLNDQVVYRDVDAKDICAVDDVLEYHAFNLKSGKPDTWFEFYGRNIGKEGKTDPYHMFPLSFDQKLKSFPCVIRTSEDTSSDKEYVVYNIIMYFYGKMINNETGEVIEGCYEYIVNDRGTLFHRLFRSIDKLPVDVVTDILKRSKC